MKRKNLLILGLIFILSAGIYFVFDHFGESVHREILMESSRDPVSEKQNPEMANEAPDESKEDSGAGNSNAMQEKNEEVESRDISNQGEKTESSIKIKIHLVSWGYQKSESRSIDTIIIHTSYNALGGDEYDTDRLIAEYKDYGVSPHYLIDRKGNIYRLVEDKNIAYHAGESQTPDGRSSVNSFSLGVELANTKKDEPTASQYESLEALIAYFKEQYDIKYILGHKDIAEGRKDDPWNFDWDRLK